MASSTRNELVLVRACVVASWLVFQLPVFDVHVLVVTAKGPYFVFDNERNVI